MLFKILIGIVVVLLLLAAFIATRPSEFRITRSATIAAPPELVFAHVNDFHNWKAWSPWEKLDPELKRTYEGPSAGAGTIYSWVGNKQVGEGRMTITDSQPSEQIGIKLEFIRPFAATNATLFTFKPQGDQTLVTWSMTGQNHFCAKAFCLFMNMDKMIGGDFEKGLAEIKAVAEKATKS